MLYMNKIKLLNYTIQDCMSYINVQGDACYTRDYNYTLNNASLSQRLIINILDIRNTSTEYYYYIDFVLVGQRWLKLHHKTEPLMSVDYTCFLPDELDSTLVTNMLLSNNVNLLDELVL